MKKDSFDIFDMMEKEHNDETFKVYNVAGPGYFNENQLSVKESVKKKLIEIFNRIGKKQYTKKDSDINIEFIDNDLSNLEDKNASFVKTKKLK